MSVALTPAAVRSGNLLTRLREETRAAHDAIEQAFDLERRVDDKEKLLDALERFYAFHREWEPAIAALIDDDAFFAPRRKLALLTRDLTALGLTATDLGKLPFCPPMHFLADRSRAVGSMYVLEGSTLGGQLIVRRLRHAYGPDAPGSAYFGSYGRAVGPMWQAFRAYVLALDLSPSAQDEAVDAAKRTFTHLQSWLTI